MSPALVRDTRPLIAKTVQLEHAYCGEVFPEENGHGILEVDQLRCTDQAVGAGSILDSEGLADSARNYSASERATMSAALPAAAYNAALRMRRWSLNI